MNRFERTSWGKKLKLWFFIPNGLLFCVLSVLLINQIYVTENSQQSIYATSVFYLYAIWSDDFALANYQKPQLYELVVCTSRRKTYACQQKSSTLWAGNIHIAYVMPRPSKFSLTFLSPQNYGQNKNKNASLDCYFGCPSKF